MARRRVVVLGIASALGLIGALVFYGPAAPLRPPRGKGSARGATTQSSAPLAPPSRAPAPRAAAPSTPSLPEPMIDIPADPPPADAGDEATRSGLPRPLFEAMARLADVAPEPPRFGAAERKLGRVIPDGVRDALTESFRRHHDEAATTIGYFRLGEVSEADAKATVDAARQRFEADAAALLDARVEDVRAAFAPLPPSP